RGLRPIAIVAALIMVSKSWLTASCAQISMKSVLYVRATSSEACMTHTGSQVGPQGPSGPPSCRQFVVAPRVAALTIRNPACPGVGHGGLGWACARIMHLVEG